MRGLPNANGGRRSRCRWHSLQQIGVSIARHVRARGRLFWASSPVGDPHRLRALPRSQDPAWSDYRQANRQSFFRGDPTWTTHWTSSAGTTAYSHQRLGLARTMLTISTWLITRGTAANQRRNLARQAAAPGQLPVGSTNAPSTISANSPNAKTSYAVAPGISFWPFLPLNENSLIAPSPDRPGQRKRNDTGSGTSCSMAVIGQHAFITSSATDTATNPASAYQPETPTAAKRVAGHPLQPASRSAKATAMMMA